VVSTISAAEVILLAREATDLATISVSVMTRNFTTGYGYLASPGLGAKRGRYR